MEVIEYHTIDKSGWREGEWTDEPDKMQFPDDATGLPCLIVRGRSGALCGYVGVPEGHPLFGANHNDARRADGGYPDVHGGLTFSSKCQPSKLGEGRGICHVPGHGEPDHVWWLGFDCAHGGDVTPAYSDVPGYFTDPFDTYKDAEYVKAEVRRLARQLAPLCPRTETDTPSGVGACGQFNQADEYASGQYAPDELPASYADRRGT